MGGTSPPCDVLCGKILLWALLCPGKGAAVLLALHKGYQKQGVIIWVRISILKGGVKGFGCRAGRTVAQLNLA